MIEKGSIEFSYKYEGGTGHILYDVETKEFWLDIEVLSTPQLQKAVNDSVISKIKYGENNESCNFVLGKWLLREIANDKKTFNVVKNKLDDLLERVKKILKKQEEKE